VTQISDNEFGGVNPADVVTRCAWKGCDKGFQGRMPSQWSRHPMRSLGAAITKVLKGPSDQHYAAVCPKHAPDLETLLTVGGLPGEGC
jgi:hypothetical protein